MFKKVQIIFVITMLLVCIIPAITNAKTVTTFKAASRYMSSKLRQAQIPAQLSLTTTNNYSSKTVCKKVLNSMIDYDDDISNVYMGDYTSSEIVDRVRIRVSKKVIKIIIATILKSTEKWFNQNCPIRQDWK